MTTDTVKNLQVAICICTHNRPNYLASLLAHMQDIVLNGYNPQSVKLIVVDNDPNPETAAICQNAAPYLPIDLYYVEEKKAGVTYARNRAIATALEHKAEFMALIDDDDIPQHDWLVQLLNRQAETDAGLVFGTVMLDDSHLPEWAKKSNIFHPSHNSKRKIKSYRYGLPKGTLTGNVLIGRKIIERIAATGEVFSHAFSHSGGEDKNFFIRARNAGAKLAWEERSVVHCGHEPKRFTIKEVFKRGFKNGCSTVALALTHGSYADIMTILVSATIKLLFVSLLLPVSLFSRSFFMRTLYRAGKAYGRLYTTLTGRGIRYYSRLLEPIDNESVFSANISIMGRFWLYYLAFCTWLSRELSYLGLLAMIMTVAPMWREIWAHARFRRQIWIHASWWGFLALSATVATLQDPSTAILHTEDAARLALLSGFLLIAWHIGGSETVLLRCLLLMAGGFFLGRLIHFDPAILAPELPSYQVRHLVSIGLNPTSLANASASVVLGITLFLPRMFNRFNSPAKRWLLVMGTCFFLGLATVLLVLSQSRTMWIGVILVFPLVVFTLSRKVLQAPRNLFIIVVASLVLALPIAGLHRTIGERVTEIDSMQSLLSDDWSSIQTINNNGEENSVGVRIVMLQQGWTLVKNHPWFGLGPAATRIILARSENPSLNKFNDFHNALLNLLICYGIVGTGLMCLAFLWPLAALLPKQSPVMSSDVRTLLVCGIVLLFLGTLTNYRLLNFDWRFWLYFTMGASASFAWWPGGRQSAATRQQGGIPLRPPV